MGEQQENNDSTLGAILATIGAIAALISGNAQDMSAGAIIMLMLIVGAIGYGIGRWVELLIVCVLFLIAAIIMLLTNMVIRRFVWELLSAIFNG